MIFVLALSCFSFIDYINKEGIKTNGKIVTYKLDNDGKKTPIIEFKTLEGKLITKTPYYYFSTDLSFLKTFSDKKDESIEVIYDKKKPQKFLIKTENNSNSVILTAMLIISIIFIAIPIAELLELIKIEI